MKIMNRFLFLILPFILSGVVFPSAGSARALTVDDIRFGLHPGKVRMVLELSETAEFRAFVLADPFRMVIDLPSFEWQAGAINKPASSAISGVRQGNLRSGISRIVFDLTGPAVIESAFFLPQNKGLPDRLVIDYANVPHSVFSARKGKILGTLDIDTDSSPVRKASAAVPVPVPQNKRKKPVAKPLVVIDAGHGGKDPGAVGARNVYEKNITLAAAKELKRQLVASGQYRVKMTRETDIYLRLHERVAVARNNEADLFVSVHADSIDNPRVRGASVYTLSKKASDAQTAKLAERENRADLIGMDLSGEDEDVAIILTDLLVNDTMNQSKFFANTLKDAISRGGTRMLPNPHRSAGFAVLKAPEIPSVLIEIGFMSNAHEARMLNSGSYRRKIISSIKSGIDAYFDRVRRNNRT